MSACSPPPPPHGRPTPSSRSPACTSLQEWKPEPRPGAIPLKAQRRGADWYAEPDLRAECPLGRNSERYPRHCPDFRGAPACSVARRGGAAHALAVRFLLSGRAALAVHGRPPWLELAACRRRYRVAHSHRPVHPSARPCAAAGSVLVFEIRAAVVRMGM